IGPTELEPLAKQIVHKSLIGLSPADAAEAVLEAVGYQGSPSAAPWAGRVAPRSTACKLRLAESMTLHRGSDLRLEQIPGTVKDSEDGTPRQHGVAGTADAHNLLMQRDQTDSEIVSIAHGRLTHLNRLACLGSAAQRGKSLLSPRQASLLWPQPPGNE